MKKEIDIFGWKYELSKQEVQFIQAILVLTIMCLILMKGLTSPLALKFLVLVHWEPLYSLLNLYFLTEIHL
jgi:hypothetical protein